METAKTILILVIPIFIFTGCQQTVIKEYNKISEVYTQKLDMAEAQFGDAIANYNNQKYEEATTAAAASKKEFVDAKKLAEQGKELAQKIKDKNWLAEFKEIQIQIEDLRIEQCDLLASAASGAKNLDRIASQGAINKMSELDEQYDQMQETLADIKNKHPESFQ